MLKALAQLVGQFIDRHAKTSAGHCVVFFLNPEGCNGADCQAKQYHQHWQH